MALALFKDICLQTNRLIDEEEIFSAALSAERHPLFAEALQRDFGSTSMA
jgi:hypothetical protein